MGSIDAKENQEVLMPPPIRELAPRLSTFSLWESYSVQLLSTKPIKWHIERRREQSVRMTMPRQKILCDRRLLIEECFARPHTGKENGLRDKETPGSPLQHADPPASTRLIKHSCRARHGFQSLSPTAPLCEGKGSSRHRQAVWPRQDLRYASTDDNQKRQRDSPTSSAR